MTLVGELNRETLALTGLPVGTKVYKGGQDQKVAAYAAGIHAGRASLALGTAGALEIFVAQPAKQTQLPFFPYILPEKTLVEGVINTTGAAIGWMKDTLFADVDYDRMNEMAASAPIGAGGLKFYPHLARPGTPNQHLDAYGSIEGLSLFTGRGELIRSLYEGLAYEIRLNLEAAARAGSQTEELIAFGGASRSQIFCRIIADVTGMPIRTAQNSELSAVGAAKLAAAGMGLDAEAFGKGALGGESCCLPDKEASAAYDTLYADYIQYYQ